MLLALTRNYGPKFSPLAYSTVTDTRYHTVCSQNRLSRTDSDVQILICFKHSWEAIALWVQVTSHVIQNQDCSRTVESSLILSQINTIYEKAQRISTCIITPGKDSVDFKSKVYTKLQRPIRLIYRGFRQQLCIIYESKNLLFSTYILHSSASKQTESFQSAAFYHCYI